MTRNRVTLQTIADALGVPENTAKTFSQRAKSLLRERLREAE